MNGTWKADEILRVVWIEICSSLVTLCTLQVTTLRVVWIEIYFGQ